MSIQIGKTRIDIKANGCRQCGNQTGSRAWYVVEVVTVTIGKKVTQLEIHICDECQQDNFSRQDGRISGESETDPPSR
jgi:hypothetical protein